MKKTRTLLLKGLLVCFLLSTLGACSGSKGVNANEIWKPRKPKYIDLSKPTGRKRGK